MASSFDVLRSNSFLLLVTFVLLNLSLTAGHGGVDHGADGETAAHDLRAKGLVLVKVYCLIIMFFSTFAGGVSPYFYRWNETFLLLGTQFAGGVFLGTSLMHFLSDSNDTFGSLTTKTYPFAFMLASAGYLLTMLGDCVIVYVTRRGGGGVSGDNKVAVQVEEAGNGTEYRKESVDHHPVLTRTSSLSDTILLILALCFHSVFEGIAVGVSCKFLIFLCLLHLNYNDTCDHNSLQKLIKHITMFL